MLLNEILDTKSPTGERLNLIMQHVEQQTNVLGPHLQPGDLASIKKIKNRLHSMAEDAVHKAIGMEDIVRYEHLVDDFFEKLSANRGG